MRSLLEQLENNEAILLMYLAGELPEADRAEVEQMLGRDPALQRALDELHALQTNVSDMLGQASVAPARQEIVAARLSKEMNRFAASRRQVKPEAADAPHRMRIGPVIWRGALAASLLIGAIGLFWKFGRSGSTQPERFATPTPVPENVYAERLPDILGNNADVEPAPADANLKQIESELVKLASMEEDPLGFTTIRDKQ